MERPTNRQGEGSPRQGCRPRSLNGLMVEPQLIEPQAVGGWLQLHCSALFYIMAKRKLVPRTRNHGTMTEAGYFGGLRSALRRHYRYWKPAAAALNAAKRKSQSKNKRLKSEYACASCKKWFPRKEVEIDHVEPCGSLRCLEDIAPFFARLTAEGIDSYQILCKPCHQDITNQEREQRKNK